MDEWYFPHCDVQQIKPEVDIYRNATEALQPETGEIEWYFWMIVP